MTSYGKIVSAVVENGLDWLPHYVGRVKRARGGNTSFETKLSMEPIDYFYRNIYFTYINETHAVENRQTIGIDNLMFATDYPHSASTWPKSQEIVARDMTNHGVSDEEHRKLIRDNVIRCYNIQVPVLV